MRVYLGAFGNPNITIGEHCCFGRMTRLSATDNGSIVIGNNVNLSEGAHLITRGGKIVIGDNVDIGVGSMVVSQACVTIQKNALIAEYVVIRDQDHSTLTKPYRQAGFSTAPIAIGENVWIGCKATVLKGATVGSNSVIGAHSLVNKDFEAGSLIVGTPARFVRKLSASE